MDYQNTSCQGEDIERNGCHALDMAARRIQCLLRQTHFTKRRYGYGKSGPLHPSPSDEVLCRDPEYSWDQYIQSQRLE